MHLSPLVPVASISPAQPTGASNGLMPAGMVGVSPLKFREGARLGIAQVAQQWNPAPVETH